MDTETSLLAALHADPADDTARLALADCLEETGRAAQAQLLRLHVRQRQRTGPEEELELLLHMLLRGVRPVVPEVVNSIGMRFALIPAGTFTMGSPEQEPERHPDEGPQHEVQITRPFSMSVFHVTQQEYWRVMRRKPSHFNETRLKMDTSNFPVEQVTWRDAVLFCQRLGERKAEQDAGRTYRLPTEAEWEYAARGGAAFYRIFPHGNTLSSHHANFDGNRCYGLEEKGPYLDRTCAVGSYPPNAFGLYDMNGNLYQFMADRYSPGYYSRSPTRNPTGPRSGRNRVFRGGGWYYYGNCSRCAGRHICGEEQSFNYLGLRVVLEWQEPKRR